MQLRLTIVMAGRPTHHFQQQYWGKDVMSLLGMDRHHEWVAKVQKSKEILYFTVSWMGLLRGKAILPLSSFVIRRSSSSSRPLCSLIISSSSEQWLKSDDGQKLTRARWLRPSTQPATGDCYGSWTHLDCLRLYRGRREFWRTGIRVLTRACCKDRLVSWQTQPGKLRGTFLGTHCR